MSTTKENWETVILISLKHGTMIPLKITNQELKTGSREAILFEDFIPLGDMVAIFKYKVAILESFSFTDVAAVVWTNTV